MFVVVGGGAMVVVAVLGYGLLWWCDFLGVYVVFDAVVFFFFFGFKILNYLLLKYHCFQLNYFIRLILIFQIPQSSTIELLKKKKNTLVLFLLSTFLSDS